MKRLWPLFIAFALTTPVGILLAGTVSYVAIPSAQSDANSGIARRNGYTTAVDGGNTRGADRMVNGITLYSLSGAGQTSAMADNCTVNALSGTLTDAGLTSKNVAADGSIHDVLSDMLFNNAGGDNSQLEVVLDPESLEEGSTYELRVYVCSSSGQNRQVNLAFFGDGQDGVETGFFNEDDARTSAGRFQSPGQVYYISYRYTWDGDSTPGITITQKFGGAPFCLYALTNELIAEGQAAVTGGGTTAAAGGASAGGEAQGGEEEAAGEGDEGLAAGMVDNQESDQIGVESDDFYGSESLNSNGRWVKLSKWGTCWQPTNVSEGWAPYTNGSWKDCDDCGWTFVSDEPWAWACYHYGRWAKVSIGCGWAWVPGTVWAPSWVSWRQEREGAGRSCSCIGWAPLPPEAGCQIGVGISSWVDSSCNIGPDCYTFINIRDFGSDSYWGCGCIYERYRNPGIIIDTFNCTNICYNRHVNIYCGGPDYNWCNTRIRQLGGKECGKVYVNRYDNPGKLGGKFARHEGNQLGLVSPKIHHGGGEKLKFRPKIAETAGANKIDHGWKGIKNRNEAQKAREHIAQENKGKNPRNSPAKLPNDVAERMKHHGGGQAQAGGGQGGGGSQGAGGGKHGQGQGQNAQGGGQAQGGAAGGAGGDQHPGKGRRRMGGAAAAGAAAGAAANANQNQGGGDQHPGRNKGGINQGRKAGGGQMQGAGGGAGQQAGGGSQAGGSGQQAGLGGAGRRHPGQKMKGGQTSAGSAGGGQGQGAGGGGGGGEHPGRRNGKGQGAATAGGGQSAGGGQQAGGGAAGGAGQGGGGKGRGKKGFQGAHAQSNAGQQMKQGGQGQAQTGQAGGGGGGGKKSGQSGRHKQTQQQQQGGQGQGQGQGAGSAGGGGGQGRRRHQPQQMQQGGGGGQGQTQGGGGGGGQGRHRQQQGQQQQQQVQQQQQHQQHQQQGGGGGGGGGGKRRRGSPTPPPG